MKVLMRCDGCFDFDSVLVSEQERTIVNKLLRDIFIPFFCDILF